MDASQYKDYVLVLLFVKYISDKYANQPYAPISIPQRASFADMIALKGKSDIGDQINKKFAEWWKSYDNPEQFCARATVGAEELLRSELVAGGEEPSFQG